MRTINEYILLDGFAESYHDINIPEITELSLSKDSYVLSVLSERIACTYLIKVYVEEDASEEHHTKKIALVTARVPENGIGWRFVNSLVISTGSYRHPTHEIYHAYVKVC